MKDKSIPEHFKVYDDSGAEIPLTDNEKLAIMKALDDYHKTQKAIYRRILARHNST